MIIMCHLRKFIIAISLLFLFFINNSYSQTFSKIGIKTGFLTSGLSTFNQHPPYSFQRTNLYIYDESDYFTYINFDIGVFAELFNSNEFCVSTELHYMVKGEKDNAVYTLPNPFTSYTGDNYENGTLNDKAEYLSLQILPRYRAGISEDGKDNLYLFAGPTFNFLVKNMGVYTEPKYVETRKPFGDIGAAFGIGFEFDKTYTFELKLDYSITGSYDFKYDNDSITRRYNAFSVLGGVALSQLFKKN